MGLVQSQRFRSGALGLLVMVGLVGGYLGVMKALDRAPILNEEVVVPGRLIRSAQPQPGDLDRLLAQHGLGTIFCLRGEERPEVISWAREHGVKVLSLQLWSNTPPRPEQIGLFFDVMRGETVNLANYEDVIFQTVNVEGRNVRFPFPVLLHCESGADRTGLMVALYRIAFQNWSVEQAKREMTRHFHLSFRRPEPFKFLDQVAPTLTPDFGHRGPLPPRPEGKPARP